MKDRTIRGIGEVRRWPPGAPRQPQAATSRHAPSRVTRCRGLADSFQLPRPEGSCREALLAMQRGCCQRPPALLARRHRPPPGPMPDWRPQPPPRPSGLPAAGYLPSASALALRATFGRLFASARQRCPAGCLRQAISLRSVRSTRFAPLGSTTFPSRLRPHGNSAQNDFVEGELNSAFQGWIKVNQGGSRSIQANQSKSKRGGLAAPTLPPPAPAFRKRLAQTTSATAAALSDAAASALRARFRETCRSAPVSKNASERREIQRRSDLIRVNPTFATHMKSMTYVLARF